MFSNPAIQDFHLDFETRSRVDLGTVGSVKYATHPSTEALLLTWCFGRSGSVRAWRKGQPIPTEIHNVATNPHLFRFNAWNVGFDYMIWTQVLSKLIPGLKRPPIENIEDTMALSNHHRTGSSLEACAKILRMPFTKDPEGRRLMLKACKPSGKTGEFYELTAEEWIKFERYGIVDTVLLRNAYYALPPLPAQERWLWEWTFRRNLRGLNVDMDLVNEFKSILNQGLPPLLQEFQAITGHVIGSNVKVKEYFQKHYPWIKNMQADTVRDMLADARPVPPQVRRALEIKDLAGSTSISKVDSILDREIAGKIYEILVYHKAGTKRHAGTGVQIQNFPRPDDKLLDSIDFDMNIRNLAGYVRSRRPGLKDPVGFVVNLLRRVWLPTPGNKFYCGDFSKIEPTVLFWLTGMGPIPKKWYEEMAAEIYNKSPDQIGKESQERQVGKTAALSCGYGAGWKSFILKTYKDTGIRLTSKESKQVIHAYRNKYPEVTKFWKDLEVGFRLAIQGQTSSLCGGKIHIMPMQYPWKGVQIRLPSGGHLFYHYAEEHTKAVYEAIRPDAEGEFLQISEKHWTALPPFIQTQYQMKFKNVLRYLSDQGNGRIDFDEVYGGLLCENVCSAVSREILTPAMWRLENADFDVTGIIHDEVWGDGAPGRDEEFTKLMCVNPTWCDVQITADLKCGDRYLK